MKTISIAAALLLTATAPAAAQDGWNFIVGAGTDNRSKDASKSDGDGFVWGQAERSSADGAWFAGAGFETVRTNGSDVELEASGGYRPQWFGFEWELSAAHKWQVNAAPGQDADAWELTADVSRAIGPFDAGLQLQHSPDGTGAARAWTWVEARAGWEFRPGWSVDAALGHREQDDARDYTGWNAGVVWAATRALELELRYHDTDARDFTGDSERYSSAVVLGANVAF